MLKFSSVTGYQLLGVLIYLTSHDSIILDSSILQHIVCLKRLVSLQNRNFFLCFGF